MVWLQEPQDKQATYPSCCRGLTCCTTRRKHYGKGHVQVQRYSNNCRSGSPLAGNAAHSQTQALDMVCEVVWAGCCMLPMQQEGAGWGPAAGVGLHWRHFDEKALCWWFLCHSDLSRSIAAVVKDSFLEERRELTDGVLGQGQSYFVDVKGGRLRLEHHTEKLPEVFL